MAIYDATREAYFLHHLMQDIFKAAYAPIIFWEDNVGACEWANSQVLSAQTKHIAIRYHFSRRAVEDRVISIQKIPTSLQIADSLTKNLSKSLYLPCRDRQLGLIPKSG